MKPFLIQGILILLLGCPVWAADMHGVWEYDVDKEQYIDGFAWFEVVGEPPNQSYIPLEGHQEIMPTEREIFFEIIIVGKECRQFAMIAWYLDDTGIMRKSNYNQHIGCARPDEPLIISLD